MDADHKLYGTQIIGQEAIKTNHKLHINPLQTEA